MTTTDRPQHVWNDPDGDGHNCASCPDDSIWKCDRPAHPDGTLADDPVARRLGFVTDEEWKAAHDHDEPSFSFGCLGCARHNMRIALAVASVHNESEDAP